MEKGKRSKSLIAVIIILVTIFVVLGIVKATNVEHFAVGIIDDGSKDLNGNEQTEFTKKIVEDNLTNFVYELNLKNKLTADSSKEVAILIDTSKSMITNDVDSLSFEKAKQLVEQLFTNVEGVKISISDTTGVKYNLSTSEKKEEMLNAISNLEFNNGNHVDEGIGYAKNTFSSTTGNKKLVIFSDATDRINEVSNVENTGIDVFTILTNMTRESYVVNNVSTVGKTYMVGEEYIDDIVNSLNLAISNIQVTDVIADELMNCFDFEVVSKRDEDVVEKTNEGYIWKVNDLKAQEIATLKIKFTIKNDVTIDSEVLYKEFSTSKNTNVSYKYIKQETTYDVTKSPTLLICEKYSFTLQAVSSENKDLNVEGIKFDIIGKDESGKVVYEGKDKITDVNGQIKIIDLRTIGNINFTLTPKVDKIGYDNTDSTELTLKNDITKRELFVTTDSLENTIDNVERNVLVKMPIETQKFTFEVNLQDKANSGIKIANTEFRLIQPKLNSKYELTALYGTTNSNGKVIFNPTIMTKAGTYDYLLSQTSENEDYESLGNVTIKVTFDENGNVTKVVKKYNDLVQVQQKNSRYVVINGNAEANIEETFKFKLKVVDKESDAIKLDGASYTLEVSREAQTTKYTNLVTDENGEINLDLAGTGYVQIKITEEHPNVMYNADTETKTVMLYKKDGKIQFVISNLNTSYGDNDLSVTLTSELKAERCSIQLQLMDIQENDIFLPNVKVRLEGLSTSEAYNATTDSQGKINFLILPQKAGDYAFKVIVDNTTLPNGYSPIEEPISISVRFDSNYKITYVSDIEGPIVKCDTIEYEEEGFIYNTAYVAIGASISEEDSNNFQIKLADSESGSIISDASYKIAIDYGDSVREINGRKTDANGMISTRLLSKDNVKITAQQLTTQIGYTIDTTIQEITLKKINQNYQIVTQEPYDYSNSKNGAVVEDKNITYYATNEKKSGENVLLNLYVNKMDKGDNLLAGVPLKIYSDELRNADGNALSEIVTTDDNGYIELEKVKVPDMPIPGEKEYILYIAEVELKDEEYTQIENTLIKLKLTFRYNENTQIVELTNTESTWGNRLIKNKTFNGYETSLAYESNLYLDIYGNYDESGNFSLDLTKTNLDNLALVGAKYDIVVTRPDGTKLIRKDVEIKDNVEFDGFYVTQGTKIEITEKQAPIGYEVNEYTEILTVTNVQGETGSVEVQLEPSSYQTPRAEITATQEIPLGSGLIKSAVTLNLKDQEVSTFEIGITTKDSTNAQPVKGAQYEVVSQKGSQNNTEPTGEDGKTSALVGGNYNGETVKYTITEMKTPTYYKKLINPIEMVIVFNADTGEIDTEATMNSQIDTTYGKTWNILNTNILNGSDIEIQINSVPEDYLNIQVEAVDEITTNKIENVEYKITPSIVEAKGTTNIQVGYVAPNSTQTYTIQETNAVEGYQVTSDQTFKIVYDKDGKISQVLNLSDKLELVSSNEKSISLKIKKEPKVPFVLNAVGYFNNTPLANAEYTITSQMDSQSIVTNDEGKATGKVDILGTNETKTYTISLKKIPAEYVKIDDFKVNVHYNESRKIDDVSLAQENRWVEVSYIEPSMSTDLGYNGNSNGIIVITTKLYPEFKINLENVDRLDTQTKLSGAIYSVESTIGTSDSETLMVDGQGIANLDKTVMDGKATYTIKEKQAAAMYQKLEKEIKVEVTFDINGYVKNVEVIDGADLATASKIEPITVPEENFKINVQIKNNKMLKINMQVTDSQDDSYYLRDCKFIGTSSLNDETLSTDNISTDINGQGTLKFDKDLANQTIIYTIHQNQKNGGYQYPVEDLKIEVTFDNYGKMINDSVRIIQGTSYTQILNLDSDAFSIDLKLTNKQTKQFGVQITTTDKYDDNIKLEGIKLDSYLLTDDYAKDEKYQGSTQTDSKGEGDIQFEKYDGQNGEIRQLRIIESNIPEAYREIRAGIMINIRFNADGIIEDASVSSGMSNYFGWLADSRFVSVTHTNYTVIVNIKHYPKLNMSVSTQDMYTGENLSAKYQISTTYGPYGTYTKIDTKSMQNKIAAVQDKIYEESKRVATLQDLKTEFDKDGSIEKVSIAEDGQSATITVVTRASTSSNSAIIKTYTYIVDTTLYIIEARGPFISTTAQTGLTNIDYIGNGLGEILSQTYQTTESNEYEKAAIGATEVNTTRDFYVYELQEPSGTVQYQKYRTRYEVNTYSKIIAKITVKYDTKGRMISAEVTEQRSKNNIDSFIEVNIIDGLNLEVKVKYAPITTMEITTLDAVTNQALSNTRIMPFGNSSSPTSRQSYEYRSAGYYTTNSNGKTNVTYWGANISDGQNEYYIDSSLMTYKGYYAAGTVKVKVSYDEKGMISSAHVITTDENGLPNAEITEIENNKLKINILYNRKFNITVNKTDYSDSNTKLTARFNITSQAGDNKDITSNNMSTVGIIRPGETVKYTLSETYVPAGYWLMENLDFYVTFNENGTIQKAWSDNELFQLVKIRTDYTNKVTKSISDIEINIKNKPKFEVKLNTYDKFYPERKLEGVAFEITNNKGDISTGNAITDANGRLNTYLGTTYCNETVTYTIKQINTINGYNNSGKPIVIQVEFNENGKIKNYHIVSGQDMIKIDEHAYENQRYISLDIIDNKPEDFYIGLNCYDKLTGKGISGITYNVSSQEIQAGSAIKSNELITDTDGKVIKSIDTFVETTENRIVNYTISEITIPNTYRKIQDIVVQIVYYPDGSIASRNVLSNPSQADIQIALGSKFKYLNGTPVQMLINIQNDNSYDIVIKNEDKNFTDLGIEGTTYDVNINGKELKVTSQGEGISKILNRSESGEITLIVSENAIGAGYKEEINNTATIKLLKGTQEYSLSLLSNSNPEYVTAEVNEEFGTVNIKLKNETKSSITICKDVKEVRYNVTSQEKDSQGNYSNKQTIGTDLDSETAEQNLHYDLGATPQNKIIEYNFEEALTPANYHKIENIKVTVEYDIYGRIKNITDNSERVYAIENSNNKNDIIVIVSEYIEETPDPDVPENPDPDVPENPDPDAPELVGLKQPTITLVKNNAEVRYEISIKEIDESGNFVDETVIGTDENSTTGEEKLHYDINTMKKGKRYMITVKEKMIPEDYNSNGTINITVSIDKDGLITSISNDNEKASSEILPTGTNNIIVIIAPEETKLLVLEKNNKEVRYEVKSKQKNDDGTYSDEKIIGTDIADEEALIKLSYILKGKNIDKTIVYTITEVSKPEDYVGIGEFDITVTYDENGNITTINKSTNKVQASKTQANSIYIKILTEQEIEKINKPYSIKVVSEEVDTNLRVNNSQFDVDITKDKSIVINESKDILTKNIEKSGYILEKGVINVSNIKKEGNIYVEVNQTAVAEGYKFGIQKTSGTVQLKVEYDINSNPIIQLENNDGLEVIIDNTNKEVIVKVKNEAESSMNITSKLKKYNNDNDDENNNDEKKEIVDLEGMKYNITSMIQTSTSITDTDLNAESKVTDAEGKTKVAVGTPYLGKTVLYTIKQSQNAQCKPIGDIVISVQYDTKGLIKYYEAIKGIDNVEITGEYGTRNISITVTNDEYINNENYQVVLEKHHIYDEEYGELIPGAVYKIEVKQEFGEATTTWEGITDENGEIPSQLLDGYGNIQIKITELSAPKGFELDSTERILIVNRNKDTKKLEIISSNINYGFSKDNRIIYVKPVDEPLDTLYTIIANKVDATTGMLITNSTAEFEVTMIEDENLGTQEEPIIIENQTDLGIHETVNKGKAKIEGLQIPKKPGTYRYILKETKAPEGYIQLEEDIQLQITFVQDDIGKMLIESAKVTSGEAEIVSQRERLVSINIKNLSETMKDDEYVLDITKIDGETKEPITAEGLFKLWTSDGLELYSESSTSEPGKLDKFFLKTDIDKKVDLTHMKFPEQPGVYTYTFKEAIAPEGYTKIEEEMKLSITFDYDENGKMSIISYEKSGDALEIVNYQDKVFTINISNYQNKAQEFTIHYEANDKSEGTVVPADQIKQKDIDIILDTLEPTRTGYTFKGWSTVLESNNVEFKPGDTYSLNQDLTLYAVWEEDLYLKSTQYVIGESPEDYKTGDLTQYKDGDEYISRVLPYIARYHEDRTVLEVLKKNITTNADSIEVYKENGELLTGEEKIGTNMKLKLTKGNQIIELTIIVTGDANGDGIITAADISKITNYRLGKLTLEGVFLQAADTNYDKTITAADKSKLSNVRLNILKDF